MFSLAARFFRIAFEPRPKSDALIDKVDLAPVLVTTRLAHGVPVLVKTLPGTNPQQIGFKVVYGKFDDNLWFPVNYSGELKIRILFVYARTISPGLSNSGFRKADVRSTIRLEK